MSTLREEIAKYQPAPKKQYANIGDLDHFNIDDPVVTEVSSFGAGKYLIKNGTYYRMQEIVLDLVKQVREKLPDATNFTVKRDGKGRGTKYEVIPWNPEQS